LVKKLTKHGELYFNLASTCFSLLAILASVWKKWFPTLQCGINCFLFYLRNIFNFWTGYTI
jgi:hypothetical protein